MGSGMKKNISREIRSSLGRYLAILGIIALGAGFFTGLRVCKGAMVQVGDDYYHAQNMHDFRLITTVGWDDEAVSSLAAQSGAAVVSGSVQTGAICSVNGAAEVVITFHGLTPGVNDPRVTAGRLPQAANECLLDARGFNESVIGTTVCVSSLTPADTRDMLVHEEYTVVGLGTSPLYLNQERGTTSLGNGTVSAFAVIPMEGFDTDYYTEVYLRYPDLGYIYSDEYNKNADALEPTVTELAESLAGARYDDVLSEARQEIADGEAEYRSERADAEAELAEAKADLTDARQQLDEGWDDYYYGWHELNESVETAEKEFADAEAGLEEAKATLEDGEKEYADGLASLEDAEAAYADGLAEYEDGEKQYASGLAEYNSGAAQLSAAKAQLDAAKVQLDTVEGIYVGASSFHGKAQGYAAAAGYSEPGLFVDALTNATSYIGSTEAVQHATVYAKANAVLVAQHISMEEFFALPAAQQATLTAAIGCSVQEIAAAANFVGSAEYASAYALCMRVNNYISDYNGSTGVEGFLTDWGYYGAAVDAAMDELAGAGNYPLSGGTLVAMRGALDEAQEEYKSGLAEYNQGASQLAAAGSQLSAVRAQLDEAKKTLDEGRAELDSGYAELESARAELDDGWLQYEDGAAALADGRTAFENKVSDAKYSLYKAKADLEDGEEEYADGLAEFEDAKAEAYAAFADAEKELSDARKKLADLEDPETYVLTRSENVGYVCFDSDTSIVEAISTVFPLFFFLVAALICMTTMTRMVDEQRTQIGTMKALGYGSGAIAAKYMVYSGSASLIGCVFGIALGCWIFPEVLWAVYGTMYSFADMRFYFDWRLAIITVAAYLACTMLATWSACRRELAVAPAELIRPKSAASGKRILLERIPFFWKRMSFMWKVSLRNVFRYKKRMFMMILGVGGCTALVLAGLGIKDSVQDIVGFQYDEITLYDMTVTFDSEITEGERGDFVARFDSEIGDIVYLSESSMELSRDGVTKSLYLSVFDSPQVSDFIDLHDGDEKLPFPGVGECVVNNKLAETFSLSVGDEITVRSSDYNSLTLTVSGIYDNYMNNYIYILSETCVQQWGYAPEVKTAYVNLAEGTDHHAAAAAMLDEDSVLNVSVAQDMRERMSSMLSSLNYIVLLAIGCAAALAFIVLYNLTNINITERIREIATIRVLGFTRSETAVYVFRENLLLTIVGALVGLGLGVWLTSFIIAQINVDAVAFVTRILPRSYVLAFVLTLVFALVVDLVMVRRLDSINMAEALKSVE